MLPNMPQPHLPDACRLGVMRRMTMPCTNPLMEGAVTAAMSLPGSCTAAAPDTGLPLKCMFVLSYKAFACCCRYWHGMHASTHMMGVETYIRPSTSNT